MKKNILSLVITFIISIGVLSGCGETQASHKGSNNIKQTEKQESNNEKKDEGQTNNKEDSRESKDQKNKEDKSNSIKVTIKDIELIGFKVRKTDASGDTYMEAKFKNNSNQNILSIEYEYEVNGERLYLLTYNKLNAGATSELVEAPSKKTFNISDAKFLGANIVVENKGKENTYIKYDAKLDTYEQTN